MKVIIVKQHKLDITSNMIVVQDNANH